MTNAYSDIDNMSDVTDYNYTLDSVKKTMLYYTVLILLYLVFVMQITQNKRKRSISLPSNFYSIPPSDSTKLT